MILHEILAHWKEFDQSRKLNVVSLLETIYLSIILLLTKINTNGIITFIMRFKFSGISIWGSQFNQRRSLKQRLPLSSKTLLPFNFGPQSFHFRIFCLFNHGHMKSSTHTQGRPGENAGNNSQFIAGELALLHAAHLHNPLTMYLQGFWGAWEPG